MLELYLISTENIWLMTLVTALRIALNNLSYIVPDSVLQSGLMKELNDMFSDNGLFISSYDLPV